MNRTSKLNNGRPRLPAAVFLATSILAAGGLFWQMESAQAAERGQYCDAERGNACNDHDSRSTNDSLSRGSPAPDTPAEPDPPADPEPTPETPT